MTTAKETEVQLFCLSSATSKIIHLQKVWKSYVENNANCIAFIFPYINGIGSLKKKNLIDEGKLQMDSWALRRWTH